MRILIVEDEALIAMHIAMLVSELGHEVCGRVSTGEAAIRIAAEKRPDFVLMDIRLIGGIDGIEAARQIKAQNDVPVIFMTGYSEDRLREAAVAVDNCGFLSKPIRSDQIRQIIEQFMAPAP